MREWFRDHLNLIPNSFPFRRSLHCIIENRTISQFCLLRELHQSFTFATKSTTRTSPSSPLKAMGFSGQPLRFLFPRQTKLLCDCCSTRCPVSRSICSSLSGSSPYPGALVHLRKPHVDTMSRVLTVREPLLCCCQATPEWRFTD